MRTYALDNASPHGATHLDGIAGSLDTFTADRLAETVGSFPGRRCLELGAGNGSVALFIAEQVGPDGEVVAVDLDPQHIPPHDRLNIIAADLAAGWLPAGPWDVIHCRLLLGHLPGRHELLAGWCQALAPDGAIVVEEYFLPPGLPGDEVLASPTMELRHLWEIFNRLRLDIFADRGADPTFGGHAHEVLRDSGLQPGRVVTHRESWRGGDPESRHALATLQQFRHELVERGARAGFDHTAVDRLAAGLDDPGFECAGRLLCSTSGRKASTPQETP